MGRATSPRSRRWPSACSTCSRSASGRSSSHTVGPMRAARLFALRLEHDGLLEATARAAHRAVRLARRDRSRARQRQGDPARARGRGAGQVEVDAIDARLAAIRATGRLRILGRHDVAFDEPADLVFSRAPARRRDAVPRQRHALHRVRRRRRDAPGGHVLLGRWRLRRQRRGGGGRPGAAGAVPDATSCRSRIAARTSSWSSRPPRARDIAGIDAAQRAPLAHGRRDRRRPAADLGA